MTRNNSKDDGARVYLRPPMGNLAFYSREYLATVRTCVMKTWSASGPNATKREVALTLLADPELRLRVCHLEEILRARQLAARQQANGSSSNIASNAGDRTISSSAVKDAPPVQLQTALADASFAALFVLDPLISEPDWGMQVLWLSMAQLQKELGLPPPPSTATSTGASLHPTASSHTPSRHLSDLAATLATWFQNHNATATVPAAAAATDSATGFQLGSSSGSPHPRTALVPHPTLLTALEDTFPRYTANDEDFLALLTTLVMLINRNNQRQESPSQANTANTITATSSYPSMFIKDIAALLAAFGANDSRLGAVLYGMVPELRNLNRSSDGTTDTLYGREIETLSYGLSELLAAHPVRQVFTQSYSGLVRLDVRQLQGPAAHAVIDLMPFADGAKQATDSGGGDGLPVFLYEYEAPPSGVAGKPTLAAAAAGSARRDRGPSGVSTTTPNGISGISNTFSVRTRPGGALSVNAAVNAGVAKLTSPSGNAGGGIPTATNNNNTNPSTPQLRLALSHAWSDGDRALSTQMSSPSAFLAAHLASAASEPPLPTGPISASSSSILAGAVTGSATAFSRRSTMSQSSATHVRGESAGSGVGVGGSEVASFALQGTVTGFASGNQCGGSGLEGTSPSSSYGGATRFQLFDRASCGNGTNTPESLFRHSSLSAAMGGNTGFTGDRGVSFGGGGSAVLAASPGGTVGDGALHVPAEIAEVWSNATAAAAAAAANGGGVGHGSVGGGGGWHTPGMSTRRSSVTAVGGGEVGFGGVFAMSPTQESYLWDRANARNPTTTQQFAATAAAARHFATATEPHRTLTGGGALGSGLGLFGSLGGGLGNLTSYPGFTATYHGGSSVAAAAGAGAGGFVVGSAPPGLVPPLLYGNGLGGVSGLSNTTPDRGLGEFVSWPSSSMEMGTSLGGHSARLGDELMTGGGSWLLAHGGARGGAAMGCGGDGGAVAASRVLGGVGGHSGGGGGGAGVEAGGGGGGGGGGVAARAGTSTGPPPSMSEESEEAASVVGGLDLDPMALTLEAIIGFDPSTQHDLSTRQSQLGAATAAGGAPSKGLIAAAAAPKSGTSPNTILTTTSSSPTTAKTEGGSNQSSLDSSEALRQASAAAGAVNPNAVLTGWSAMAARGVAQHSAANNTNTAAAAAAAAGMQLAAAAAVQNLAAAATMAVVLSAPRPAAGGTAGLLQQGAGGVFGLTSAAAAAAAGLDLAALQAGRDAFGGKALHPKLTPRVREEIGVLLRTVPGLKAEDFDDGVLHQLTLKKSEEEAVGALRTLGTENLSGIQHMAAYINHIIKNYHLTGTGPHGQGGPMGPGAASLPSATVRANSTPVSAKAILQKLPLRVYRRLEEVISKCSYMEWKHFDAGVVKVMAQLAEIGEEDVFEELELLQSTDLSAVEYMPAYLNKRLNNRLWSRRKMLSSAAAAAAGGGGGGP